MAIGSRLFGEKQGVVLQVIRMAKKYHWKIATKIATESASLYSV